MASYADMTEYMALISGTHLSHAGHWKAVLARDDGHRHFHAGGMDSRQLKPPAANLPRRCIMCNSGVWEACFPDSASELADSKE